MKKPIANPASVVHVRVAFIHELDPGEEEVDSVDILNLFRL